MAFTHSSISTDAFYTIQQINDFFQGIADEINKKVDRDDPQDVQADFVDVLINGTQVVVGDRVYTLKGNLGLNNQSIINLEEGTGDNDAITVGQAKEIING